MKNSQRYARTILTTGVIILLVVAVASLIANAQSQPPQRSLTDPLSALLVEVHGLRIAMERSAAITPRLQLDQARLNIEEQRMTELSQQLEQVRQQIAHNMQELQKTTDALADIEKSLQTQTDEKHRAQFEFEQREQKRAFDAQSRLDQQLRARESEALRAYDTEQSRWTDLNNHLDELEKLLGPVGQQ